MDFGSHGETGFSRSHYFQWHPSVTHYAYHLILGKYKKSYNSFDQLACLLWILTASDPGLGHQNVQEETREDRFQVLLLLFSSSANRYRSPVQSTGGWKSYTPGTTSNTATETPSSPRGTAGYLKITEHRRTSEPSSNQQNQERIQPKFSSQRKRSGSHLKPLVSGHLRMVFWMHWLLADMREAPKIAAVLELFGCGVHVKFLPGATWTYLGHARAQKIEEVITSSQAPVCCG